MAGLGRKKAISVATMSIVFEIFVQCVWVVVIVVVVVVAVVVNVVVCNVE